MSTYDLALALDELIAEVETMPPAELAELMEVVAAGAPPGLLDQLQAASADALRRAPKVVGEGAAPVRAVLPRQLRLTALEALAGWLTGGARTCMHAPHPDRPQPVLAAPWRPGLIVCDQCTHLLDLVDPVANAMCDACGHVCTGVDRGDGIHPFASTIGALTFQFGLCERCFAEATTPARETA